MIAMPRNMPHSFTSTVWREGDVVIKKFSRSVMPGLLSATYVTRNSNPQERFEREVGKLQSYYEKGLLVPAYLGSDGSRRLVSTDYLAHTNLRDILTDKSLGPGCKLKAVKKSAGFLREVHEAGEEDCNTYPHNFGITPEGKPCKFDFEFEYKDGRDKRNMDLYEFMWGSAQLMALGGEFPRKLVPGKKADISPLLDAVKEGYGSLPEPVDTFWMGLSFHVWPVLRGDLYEAVLGYKP